MRYLLSAALLLLAACGDSTAPAEEPSTYVRAYVDTTRFEATGSDVGFAATTDGDVYRIVGSRGMHSVMTLIFSNANRAASYELGVPGSSVGASVRIPIGKDASTVAGATSGFLTITRITPSRVSGEFHFNAIEPISRNVRTVTRGEFSVPINPPGAIK